MNCFLAAQFLSYNKKEKYWIFWAIVNKKQYLCRIFENQLIN